MTEYANAEKLVKAAVEVADHLEAWQENADWQLRHAVPSEEAKFRNQRDNYRNLVETLRTALASLEVIA